MGGSGGKKLRRVFNVHDRSHGDTLCDARISWTAKPKHRRCDECAVILSSIANENIKKRDSNMVSNN